MGHIFKKSIHDFYTTSLWPISPQNAAMQIAQQHDCWNGISFYKEEEGFDEEWFFAGAVDKENIQSFYYNNKDSLISFIQFFKLIEQDLIQNANKNWGFFKNGPQFSPSYPTKENILMDHLKEKLHQLKSFLTPTEIRCLFHFSQNLSAKEIARLLNVSPRTVEFHLNNIKNKLNIRSKSDLTAYFRNHLNYIGPLTL